jgi:hypothetical protein
VLFASVVARNVDAQGNDGSHRQNRKAYRTNNDRKKTAKSDAMTASFFPRYRG